jgi:putative FmdB family regulatory protein
LLPKGKEEETSLPLYPYRCTACGHRFEKIQKFGAKPEEVCPKCGGVLERTLTAPGLSFKGAGWYVNDYASKSSSSEGSSSGTESASAEKKTGADGKTESAGKSESGTKSESKTESKPESKSTSGGESSSSGSSTSAPATPAGTGTK